MGYMRRQTILIADDAEINRAILIDTLGEEYEIVEACDGEEAVGILRERGTQIDLLLLDIVMPKMDGFQVLEVMNREQWIADTPVIMISAENMDANVERAYNSGVVDFISRPFDPLVVRRRVTNTLLLYAKQRRLTAMVAEQIYEKEKQSGMMIDILGHIVEFRNGESGQHVRHIHVLTSLVLRQLAKLTDHYQLSQAQMNIISTASALHDIGKIAIPSEILNKPGRLSPEEFEVMKTHATIGADMLTALPIHQDEPLVKAAHEICRWHHERYDGHGYPDGLRGDEIPISAQVVALADVYDALTSERVYKKAFTHDQAVRMILNGECGAFNPLLLECLRELAGNLPEELRRSVQEDRVEEPVHMLSDLLHGQETNSSLSRAMQLLSHERMKAKFYADMSGEIQFEFTAAPPVLTLSSYGMERLGLTETVVNPLMDKRVIRLMGEEGVRGVADATHATSPEQPVVQYENISHFSDGDRWMRIIGRVIWSDDIPPRYMGVIGKAIDIHDERTRLNNLEWLSSHDSLTGLFNHAAARERIAQRMAVRPNSKFVILIFDVDNFKGINDSRGHLFGDKVLCHIAERLRHSVRSGDIICRVGGDEFLVCLEYKGDDEPVIQRIQRYLTCSLDDYPITISMGAARSKQLGTDYETLFHAADQALYASKAAGGSQVCYYHEGLKSMLSAVSAIDGNEEHSGIGTRTKEAQAE